MQNHPPPDPILSAEDFAAASLERPSSAISFKDLCQRLHFGGVFRLSLSFKRLRRPS